MNAATRGLRVALVAKSDGEQLRLVESMLKGLAARGAHIAG